MLSVHGLVMVETDATVYRTEKGGYIQFKVASATWDKKTASYFMKVWVPEDKINEELSRFTHGTVIEIVRAVLQEVPSKLENPNKFCTAVILTAMLKDVVILKKPFFYDGLNGITLEQKAAENKTSQESK